MLAAFGFQRHVADLFVVRFAFPRRQFQRQDEGRVIDNRIQLIKTPQRQILAEELIQVLQDPVETL